MGPAARGNAAGGVPADLPTASRGSDEASSPTSAAMSSATPPRASRFETDAAEPIIWGRFAERASEKRRHPSRVPAAIPYELVLLVGLLSQKRNETDFV